jgi:hypothetical protein
MQNLTHLPLQASRYAGWLKAFLPFLALFVSLGNVSRAQAQSTIASDSITINNAGTIQKYDTQDPNPGADRFSGTDFGSFDINSGVLTITNATIRVNELGNDSYDQGDLIIRVFQGDFNSTAPGTTSSIVPLTNKGIVNGQRVFTYTGAPLNIISFANTGGVAPGTTYRFDVRFRALDNLGNSNPPSLFSPFFVPSIFEVTGSLPVTDTWTGAINDDWFNAGNWSLNRIPDAGTDVVIPNFGSGVTNRYPNIDAGVNGVTSNGTAVTNINSGPAIVRNLLLVGNNSTTDRSIMRLEKGQLNILGNFTNQFLSFIARDNTTVNFAGTNGTQTLSGGTFATLKVSGTADKAVVGPVRVAEALIFDTSAGNFLVTTDSQNPSTSFVELADRLTQNNLNGAQLVGETDNSYIYGLVQTSRANVQANEGSPRTFGNIGFTALFTGANNPGDIAVTRSTVSNYYVNGKYSVRRVFGVRPSYVNNGGGPLSADVTFTVLPNELQNLTPNGGNIAPANLSVFLSTNNGSNFTQLGRDGAPTTNTDANGNISYTVAKSGVNSFATFSLGDIVAPLPVSLVSFSATREGTSAQLVWATASEKDNKGFEIQVSVDGKTFRTLSFVASQVITSTTKHDYSYSDTEAGKSGIRYYRLRQVDLDGQDSYSPVRAVSFDGAGSLASELSIYPNPVAGTDTHLLIQTTEVGNARLRITDLMGRTIVDQTIAIANGSTETNLTELANAKSGTYLAQLTLPSGQIKSIKVQKQ